MPSCWHPRSLLDGRDNVRIGSTATDIAAHPFADFGVGEFSYRMCQIFRHVARHAAAALGQHSHGGADLTRRAIAALKAAILDKTAFDLRAILRPGKAPQRRGV